MTVLEPLQNQLVLCLGSARSFQLVPPASDREAWGKPGEDAALLCASAEDLLRRPIPELNLSDLLDAPEKWLAAREERRLRLRTLSLAAACENGGKYIRPLAEIVWKICEEGSWMAPAADGDDPLPDVGDPAVDALAAQTGMDLSVMCQMVGNPLSAFSAHLIDMIYQCLDSRVIRPFLAGNMRGDVLSLLPGAMATFLTFETDDKQRWRLMKQAWRMLDDVLSDAAPDGSVPGSMEAWLDFAAKAVDCMEIIRCATGGEIDISRLDMPVNLVRNGVNRFLSGGFFLQSGEHGAKPALDGVKMYRMGDFADDEEVCRLGAYLSRRGGYAGQDDTLWHACYRAVNRARITAERAEPPRPQDVYLPDAGMMVTRSKADSDSGFLLAAYGGSNGDENGHLDVGNVLLFSNGEPVLCDIGAFADTDLHNLPVVGGITQQYGQQYRSSDAAWRSEGEYTLLSMDLTDAYPPTAAVYGWQRTCILSREDTTVYLIDAFDMTRRQKVRFCFVSPFRPVIAQRHVQLGSVRMRWEPELTPGVEEIAVTDEKLQTVWGDTLYRLYFDTPDEIEGGEYTFTFNLLRTYGSL